VAHASISCVGGVSDPNLWPEPFGSITPPGRAVTQSQGHARDAAAKRPKHSIKEVDMGDPHPSIGSWQRAVPVGPWFRSGAAIALAGGVAAVALMPGSANAAAGDNEAVMEAIANASPAVVSIYTTAVSPAAVRGGGLETVVAAGSGVIVEPDGLILTNRHVVSGASEVTVVLDDGAILDGTVLGTDTLTDFAFVDIEGTELPVVDLGESADLQVGQVAITIGNPLGEFPNSVSVGVISGLERSIDVAGSGWTVDRLDHLIQTDAAVNSGNSGGAVVDGDGLLVGITTAEAGGADGIGFALPIDLAKPIIEQAAAGEEIARPYLGLTYIQLDGLLAAAEGLATDEGAWLTTSDPGGVSAIVGGGPADQGGLQDGDIITALAGTPVTSDDPLGTSLLRFGPGETITLTVLRDGEEMELSVTLGTRPAGLSG
jgi:S1-C subfamily serine protease